MVKIGLITEGITDQFILKPIVRNYWKEIEIHFNEIQPRVDETDKQEGFGGWVNVLRTCEEEDFSSLFLYLDFVIIQIDSDVSQEKGFDITHFAEGKQLDDKEVCESIVSKLRSLIPPKYYENNQDKFLFAIGIQSSECWLLSLSKQGNLKSKTINCLNALNRDLAKRKTDLINEDQKNSAKSRRVYQSLAREFKNRKVLVEAAKHNTGLEEFVNQLGEMNIGGDRSE